EKVEAARKKTIDIPREIAGAAAEVVALAHELEVKGNPNLRGDAVAAAILAQAAGATASMLVQVNESAGRPGAPGPGGGRGRAPARSRGSDRPSRPRTARAARSAAASRRSKS